MPPHPPQAPCTCGSTLLLGLQLSLMLSCCSLAAISFSEEGKWSHLSKEGDSALHTSAGVPG